MRSLNHAQRADANIRELAALLKTSPGEVVSKTQKMLSIMKENERELERLKLKVLEQDHGEAFGQTREINGISVQVQRTDGLTMKELRTLSDKLRSKMARGVLVLGSLKDGKVSLFVIVTKNLASQINAGELIKDLAKEIKGSGGGRPEMAQAGGSHPEGLEAAFNKAFEFVEQQVDQGGAASQ